MLGEGLNRNQLKYIAIAAMLTDHIAFAFVPLASFAGQVMHFVGRFTGPIMAYFLYEGFMHTSDKKAYAKRLAVFALISWIPFCSFEYGRFCIAPSFGVIYTLFLGFLAMMYAEKREGKWNIADSLVILGLCCLSTYGDWPVFDVLWPFCLYRFRNDKDIQWKVFLVIDIVAMFFFWDFSNWQLYICQLGCILPPLVLRYFYNGKPGKKSGFNKWVFYVFYPLHLIILTMVEMYI